MVNSINYLAAQGCNVIVDDLIFFGESYFSDSAIAQAASNAVSQGVVYVTSAGNFGDRQHYQANYLQGGTAGGNSRYHRFSTSPNDDFNDVSIPPGGVLYIFLQWSDPWGASGNDYNLQLTGTSGVAVASSTTVQNGNDFPFESIGVSNNGSTTFNGQIRIIKRNAAAARELEMSIWGHSTLQHSTAGDALVGQEAAVGVISVAAAPASNPSVLESFSSRGGSTIYTNFATQTRIVRQSLDGTAIDGVQTSIGQLGYFYNPFYGTSAASPHAAAIAALVLQADPSLAPAQVAQVMGDTATDLDIPGYDINSGAGLYNALDAVYRVFTPATPDMDAASDSGISDTDNYTNQALPSFSGAVPAGSHVRLFVDGVQSSAVQLLANQTQYSLVPGSALADGPHLITIRIASSSGVALSNNSPSSSGLAITIDSQGPTLTTAAFNYDAAVQNLSFTFSESIDGAVDPGDLLLIGESSGSIPAGNISSLLSSGNTAIFTFPDYLYGALPDDVYNATLLAGSVADAAGNLLAEDALLSFFYLAADFNRDGVVNAADLGVLSMNWQLTSRTFSTGDATYDGSANLGDLIELATRWQLNLLG
jgi:hypothetical protein